MLADLIAGWLPLTAVGQREQSWGFDTDRKPSERKGPPQLLSRASVTVALSEEESHCELVQGKASFSSGSLGRGESGGWKEEGWDQFRLCNPKEHLCKAAVFLDTK